MATIVVVIMGVAVAERSGFLAARDAGRRVPGARPPGWCSRSPSPAPWRTSPRRPRTSSWCRSAAWPSAPSAARRSSASSSPTRRSPPATTPARSRPQRRDLRRHHHRRGEDHRSGRRTSRRCRNWFFNIASSIVLATVITLVTKFVLSKRPDLDADPDADLDDIGALELSPRERSALRLAAARAGRASWWCWSRSCCRRRRRCAARAASIVESPLLDGIAAVVAVAVRRCSASSTGCASGSITKAGDVPKLMVEGIKQMAPVLVLFFADRPVPGLLRLDPTSATSWPSSRRRLLRSSGMPIVGGLPAHPGRC